MVRQKRGGNGEVKTIEIISKGERYLTAVDTDFDHKGKVWLRKGYAYISVNGKEVALHRHIMGAKPGEKLDHINRNKLDNRRSNLRYYESEQQNTANVEYKGYYYHKRARKYAAQVKYDGMQNYLGLFNTPEEAHEAYKRGHVKYFGEFSPYFNK